MVSIYLSPVSRTCLRREMQLRGYHELAIQLPVSQRPKSFRKLKSIEIGHSPTNNIKTSKYPSQTTNSTPYIIISTLLPIIFQMRKTQLTNKQE